MSHSLPTLAPPLCRVRQRRLLDLMSARGIDRVVVVTPEHVQWLTGFRPHRLMSAAVSLDVDGRCVLSAPNTIPGDVAADEMVTFEAQRLATLRQDQPAAAIEALARATGPAGSLRLGVEGSALGPALCRLLGVTDPDRLEDVEADLQRLRRKKESDELAMIRHAVAATEAMYAAAREVIAPGVSELTVFSRLHAAAVEVLGEPPTALGNDFCCGSPGGPPRPRAIEAGELYILDLGPGYRGYHADNCRTFAVNGAPTDVQQQAWEAIVPVLRHVEATVRPGVSCRRLFEDAKRMLDEVRPGGFFHHLGHGIGLYPHEAPHLNPNWDDVFEEGDVFTAEPGLYGDDLRGGIRLEEDYVVTATGVEKLTSFPLEL
ncbi:putative peptidase [Maioricimonas rarisocia]|uniref:Putative peptidase n=1 Tax=Maioricimonas rarisocia TaxID=2528026 RepID=A0A517ZG76_9PLAN|nr:Xaa-Pro peptidase family protein [Maioricimonas rarisocia]QDU41493.1 putative peptidase [Maioricimonas rarisocia]